MDRLTREDIQKIIDSPAITTDEIVKIAQEELDLELDPSLEKEGMIDAIFEAYNIALIEVEERRDHMKAKKAVGIRKSRKKEGQLSRKEFIVNLISEGKYTKDQILNIVAEEFGYKARGKSPKTRVSRVIRELAQANQLETTADGVLKLKS